MNNILTTHAQNLTDQAKDINETLGKKSEELTSHYQNLTANTKDINETLNKKVGELNVQAEDIRQSHKSIEQMLRVPKERAPFGELSLEIILSDQLPPNMFCIRQKILDGKIPDAYIKSTVGLICIDSKFPLDNYAKMEITKDLQEKENFKRQFIKDVEGHLEKIYSAYICPQKGSAEFAFAYIPSEGVYYFLMTESYQMLWNYAKKGVQVASPLMLSSKIELIKTGIQAKKLSEDTEKVRNDIIRLSQQFKDIDESWRVFYGTHFSRATVKAGEVDQGYRKLREEFGKISKLTDNTQVSGKQVTTVQSNLECDIKSPEKEYEKYEEFIQFYEDFAKQVTYKITVSQTGEIAASISSIMEDAKKTIPSTEEKEKEFLGGMKIYFDKIGINTDVVDNKYITFRRK